MGTKTNDADGLATSARGDDQDHKIEVAAPLIIVQAGHVGRTTGATGTEGRYTAGGTSHYLSEKQFADQVCIHIKRYLDSVVPRSLRVVRYDADNVPNYKTRAADYPVAVVAMHCNGNDNASPNGYNFGYPTSHPTAEPFTAAIAKAYAEVQGSHWRGSHRVKRRQPDNSTKGLRSYYVWRKMPSTAPCSLLEAGFLTNAADCQALDENKAAVGFAVALAIIRFLRANMADKFPAFAKLKDPVFGSTAARRGAATEDTPAADADSGSTASHQAETGEAASNKTASAGDDGLDPALVAAGVAVAAAAVAAAAS